MQSLKKIIIHITMVLAFLSGFTTTVMAEEHYRTTMIKSQAKSGDVTGQFNLGLLYYYGDSDVGLDYRKAREWFLKSAKQGDVDAQIYLGLMYEEGKGVRQDYTKATEYYLKAAKQNNSEAQMFLGKMYEEGKGVRQSKSQSKEWFGKACDNGEQKGCDAYSRLNMKSK